MGMTIQELITFCEEEEYNHRINCKRYDDASGYTRSKDKNIRTAVAIREEIYGNYYKHIADIMRKYQKIQEIYQWAKDRSYLVETDDIMDKLKEVAEDGNND